MKNSRIVILAALISLTAHSVFICASPFISVSGMHKAIQESRVMFQLGKIDNEISEVDLYEEIEPQVSEPDFERDDLSFERQGIDELMDDGKAYEGLALENKKESLKKEDLKELLPEKEDIDSGDLLKKDADAARANADPLKRTLERMITREEDPGSAAAFSERALILASEPADGRAYISVVRSGSDFLTQEIVKNCNIDENTLRGLSIGRDGSRVKNYDDIGEALEVSLMTYKDPSGEDKYFRLIIKAKNGNNLEVVPKDIIFLVDSSKSITEQKLTYIKEGLQYSVNNLNPGDRFNIVAFRGSLIRFRDESIRATDRTVARAKTFIRKLEAVGQTDVESALLDMIEEPVLTKPSYIVLITDGRPTTGILDSRRIIQEITRRNNRERPIFCFGGGRKVNKYLLDFISYQNRAWSRFSATGFDMGGDFSGFYNQIKDPILLNVRYRFAGVNVKDVYPKYLSDFYKKKAFTLFGRYTDEDRFSIQLLGQINGNTKELLFEGSLSDAPFGDVEIARGWAFRKIYYLISRNSLGQGNANDLRKEIDELSNKYNITTPYNIKNGDG